MKKYHNSIFDRINPDKKKKILDTATSEFAALGYNSANINIIAEKAGVSVGSLYKYFNTKEDLYLTVVGRGINTLENVLSEVFNIEGSLVDKIERILEVIQEHSRNNPDILNVYNGMTSQGNPDLARKLSMEMESVSAKYYRAVISDAKESNHIPEDVDEGIMALCLDNLFLSLQFSYGTVYYGERMKIYVGDDVLERDADIRKNILNFIVRGLGLK